MYNNMLDLNQIQMMSLEQKIDAFRNGYRLADLYNSNISDRYDSIVALASCPSQIVKDTTKPIRVSVATPGTPPYHFYVLKDGNPLYTYDGIGTETSHEFSHTFSDPIGETHNYKGYVIDSCSTPKTSNMDSCDVQIVAVAPPTGISPILIVGALGLVGLAVVVSRK